MEYKYITENNLINKQNYMYTAYEGIEFLKVYIDSRQCYLAKCQGVDIVEGRSCKFQDKTFLQLEDLYYALQSESDYANRIEQLDAFVKSFEVRKRIYTEYDDNWKPLENAGYTNYDSYILLAECMLIVYKKNMCLKYFSCLLKLDDTLLSIQDCLNYEQKSFLAQIVKGELAIFNELACKNGVLLEV